MSHGPYQTTNPRDVRMRGFQDRAEVSEVIALLDQQLQPLGSVCGKDLFALHDWRECNNAEYDSAKHVANG